MSIFAGAIGFTIVILWPAISVAETFTANQASKHIGETATICGIVASTNFAKQAKGQPTFLNLERPYPNESVTLVIWGKIVQGSESLKARFCKSVFVRPALSNSIVGGRR